LVEKFKNKIEYELLKIKKNPVFYAVFYYLKYLFTLKIAKNTKKNYKSQVFTNIKDVLDTEKIKELKEKIKQEIQKKD
jgi:hypothetical protein